MTDIDSLLKQYAKYIVDDKITNYYCFNLKILANNIKKYIIFIDEYNIYKNNTWLYFKGIYYYCKMEYSKMLSSLKDVNESYIYCLLGYYYKNIEDNNDLMKKYFEMAIELNNPIAMYYLGDYYSYFEINYDLMKKYYIMATKLGHVYSMVKLGSYYENIIYDYDLMKKYYLMAIELGDSNAMVKLGSYYENIIYDYDLMKKYYLMAIELGNADAMFLYSSYYCSFKNTNIDLMKKYYIMAADLGHSTTINVFKSYCRHMEKNENNYYKYIYYPRILTLILSTNKQNIINKYEKKNHTNLFLPEEIYKIIVEYICKDNLP